MENYNETVSYTATVYIIHSIHYKVWIQAGWKGKNMSVECWEMVMKSPKPHLHRGLLLLVTMKNK